MIQQEPNKSPRKLPALTTLEHCQIEGNWIRRTNHLSHSRKLGITWLLLELSCVHEVFIFDPVQIIASCDFEGLCVNFTISFL